MSLISVLVALCGIAFIYICYYFLERYSNRLLIEEDLRKQKMLEKPVVKHNEATQTQHSQTQHFEASIEQQEQQDQSEETHIDEDEDDKMETPLNEIFSQHPEDD